MISLNKTNFKIFRFHSNWVHPVKILLRANKHVYSKNNFHGRSKLLNRINFFPYKVILSICTSPPLYPSPFLRLLRVLSHSNLKPLFLRSSSRNHTHYPSAIAQNHNIYNGHWIYYNNEIIYDLHWRSLHELQK